jgi:hypothetical protein
MRGGSSRRRTAVPYRPLTVASEAGMVGKLQQRQLA